MGLDDFTQLPDIDHLLTIIIVQIYMPHLMILALGLGLGLFIPGASYFCEL